MLLLRLWLWYCESSQWIWVLPSFSLVTTIQYPLFASTRAAQCCCGLFPPSFYMRTSKAISGRKNIVFHPRTDWIDSFSVQAHNQSPRFFRIFFTISVCVPMASIVMMWLFMFKSSSNSGIAVISLDFSFTRFSPRQNPFSSTALTMWFAFWFLLPLPRCVLPSIARSSLIFYPSALFSISFHSFWNFCKNSGDTIVNTRCIVSWEGMPFANSKYLRKNFSCSLPNISIATHSFAFASNPKNTNAIMSFILCCTLAAWRVSITKLRYCHMLSIYISPLWLILYYSYFERIFYSCVCRAIFSREFSFAKLIKA